jgi:hypothetical protein
MKYLWILALILHLVTDKRLDTEQDTRPFQIQTISARI